MLILTIEADTDNVIGVKEELARALARFGDIRVTRVIAVEDKQTHVEEKHDRR